MTKRDVLIYLADVGEADAADMASALGVPYAASAMAALRLVTTVSAEVGQNPLPDFVVRLSLRVEAERTTGSPRP